MELRSIINLDASVSSVNKIEEFLRDKKLNTYEYSMALAHLGYLTFILGNVNDSFKLLLTYLDKCEDKFKPAIYNSLIKIYYEQKDYQNVLQAINNKKDYLPNYNKANYYEDLITYYQTLKNQKELIKTLNLYLADDISDERRLNALIVLTNCYYEDGKYQLFKEKNIVLKSLALQFKEDALYKEALYRDSVVLEHLGDYNNSLKIVSDLLDMKLNKEIMASIITLKLKLLIDLDEKRQVPIYEAENEEQVFKDGSLETKINFSNYCKVFYKSVGNNYNASLYEKRSLELMPLYEAQKEIIIEKDAKKKTFKAPPVELKIKDEIFKELKKKEPKKKETNAEQISFDFNEKPKAEEYNLIDISKAFDSLSSFYQKINNLKAVSFRELIRLFFTELNKLCMFDEAYIYLDIKGSLFYHFKKERLYDKDISLENTIPLIVFELKEEEFISNTKQTSYTNPITKALYSDEEMQSLIGLPLKNGSVTFISSNDEMLTKKLNYEAMKLGLTYFECLINDEINKRECNAKITDFSFLVNDLNEGYKRQVDNYVYLSPKAQKLLGLEENINITDMYLKMEVEFINKYQRLVNDLLTGEKSIGSIDYRMLNNPTNIREEFKVSKDNSLISIFSIIDNKIKEKAEADKHAFIDPLTKSFNKYRLYDDLDSLIESNKFSLIILEAVNHEFYQDIYGASFAEQLLYAIPKFMKKYPKNNLEIYHFDGKKFVISVKNITDKRTLTNLTNDILDYLSAEIHKLNSRVSLEFRSGVLRYPTDTTTLDKEEIFSYLLSTLADEKVSIFSKNIYKKRMFESQLVTHISESIDSNELKLEYTQVVDLLNKVCYSYVAHLNLSNFSVPEDEIYSVAKKRGIIQTIERYMLHRGIFELKEAYDNTKLFFNFTFKVSYETLANPNFAGYVIDQLKFFKVEANAINIYYDGEIDKDIIDSLKALTAYNVKISTSNVLMLKNVLVDTFYFDNDLASDSKGFYQMLLNYNGKRPVKFGVKNVKNDKEVTKYAELGITLYQGKIYNSVLTLSQILEKLKV